MQSEEDLYRLAHYDPLTQLPNRLLFIDRLKQMIELSKRHNSQCAVLFIDLDHFKMINDSLGHTFGDEVLKIIADRLKESLRTSDTVARLGGDEFIVIITDIKENSDIVSIIEQIIANVSEPIFIEDQKLHSTLSIGASLYPNDGENVDILLRNADAAMYKAKSIGRNTYQFYTSDITAEVYEHLTMETQLRQALKNNELTLYYQPQIDANRSIVTGYEALIRWNHHEMGMISPAKFIPLAEKSDLIIALGAFVLQQACQQAVVWNHKTERSHHVSINISMRQLQQSSFTQQVKDILAHTHCLPQWIEFEVTEGYVMHNPKQAIKTLQSIHDLGIKIAVDDFGTGYSSLIYLKRLPIDTLKIDQSFVRDLLTDADDRAITQTIISLAQNMGLGIIAEGVEEYAQQEFLLAHKCHDIQGFYYSAALPADEAEAWTRQFEMQSSCI
jgi:diguanylate cyclase (GGDEF)-like protein